MIKMQKTNSGFTLIEAAISATLLAIVMAAIFSIIIAAQNYHTATVLKDATHIEAKRVLDMVILELEGVQDDQLTNFSGGAPTDDSNIRYTKVVDLEGTQSTPFEITYQETDAVKKTGELRKIAKDGGGNIISSTVIATNVMTIDDQNGTRTPSLRKGISFTLSAGGKLSIAVSILKAGRGNSRQIAHYSSTIHLNTSQELVSADGGSSGGAGGTGGTGS